MVIKTTPSNEWKKIEETDKSIRYSLDFSKAKVKVFEFKKGYEVPRHGHETKALHIVTKGKIQMDDGGIVEAMSSYECATNYGPAAVLEDTQIILIEE
jgi:quercetin dioxygenase-like cupin family protein